MDFIIVYEYERFGQVGHSHEVGALEKRFMDKIR
jgi:hypothetical protein